MSRDYQPCRTTYTLTHEEYMSTLWTIRGYYRYKAEVETMVGISAVSSDGQPHGSGTGDPTYVQASRLATSYPYKVVSAVDEALTHIQEDMRVGVWASVQWRTPYPLVPSERTWGREKAKFVWFVHKLLTKDGNTGQT